MKRIWFFAAIAFGILARLIWVEDMEWKGDERIMFRWVEDAVMGRAWPDLGMASSALIQNPGLSAWIFIVLGLVFRVDDPTELCRVVMVASSLALIAWSWVAHVRIRDAWERETWFWGIALIAVNPIAISLHRKIWAQSMLPIFLALYLWAFLDRKGKWGAFSWGCVGALLGQIHMSGFPFALAVVIAVAATDRTFTREHWKYWILGSCLGAIPLLNWVYYIMTAEFKVRPTSFFDQVRQLRFYVFWVTEPLGLHIGNLIGASQSPRIIEQIWDFLRYPLLKDGRPTWIMGIAHLGLLMGGAWVYLRTLWLWAKNWRMALGLGVGLGVGVDVGVDVGRLRSDTQVMIRVILLGYGVLITALGTTVYRFYLLITQPFYCVWFARLALPRLDAGGSARLLLGAIVVAQALVSATFLHFIHVRGGGNEGTYGPSYRSQTLDTQ